MADRPGRPGPVAGAFLVAFVLFSDDGAPELTETAPVDIAGEALPATPDDPANDPARGQPAPRASGVNVQDEPVDLLADDGTIVVFLAHWCSVCQAEVPLIVEHLGGGALPDDVRLVGVPTSTSSTRGNYPPSDWPDREGWEFDVLVDSADSELAQAHGVGAFPSFVAVDADGNVQARGAGALEPDGLDASVEAARS